MTEIQSLLSSLELERAETENQAKREFLARNQILWAGIDRTIAEVKAERQRMLDEQKRAEELRRRQEEEAQRKKEEERRREEEKRLADEARRNAEKAERERQQAERARQEAELKQSQVQEQQRIVEANRASAEQNALTSLQKNEQRWEKWVEHQRKTKTEVIERVKADDELRKNIGAFKRKITRRIGQIVNTRESIVNIVSTQCFLPVLFTKLKRGPVSLTDASHSRGSVHCAFTSDICCRTDIILARATNRLPLPSVAHLQVTAAPSSE